MIGEIIAIGDELISGRIANTTSGFAARHLFAAGHDIYAMHTIGDNPRLIGEVLKRAIKSVDFVLVTGGLGSTTDDMTNEAVAEALHRSPTLHSDILKRIREHLGHDHAPGNLEKMAWLPRGAEPLNDKARMAGYLLVHDGVPIFFLPGVPYQMRELLQAHVLPKLAGWKGNHHRVKQRVYRTFGLPETVINNRLLDLEQQNSVHVGYYPVGCEVHVSLTVLEENRQAAEEKFIAADQTITRALGDALYGIDQESLPSVVGKLLLQGNRQLSVAESCTGGVIGKRLTEVAGSSDWFAGGVIAYSNHLKEILLGVDRDLLANYGAVSEQVALAMAARLSERIQTDMTVSVTGIAGPGGGSEEKPVGTVYIGLLHQNKVSAQLYHFTGNRSRIREKTACTALDTVRRALLFDSEKEDF
ncbi:MAG TPA: CinA family nicotinamide mononucleotide deamidase-related protein [Desulfobulbus sp.]|nr:CinA family nicotinamide mononucleotide deamidase-related protein [Desulfobulbus sp.]